MATQLSHVAQQDQRSQFHPFTSINDLKAEGPTVMASGSGVRVRDVNGKEYLDGMAGLWCVNLGYGRQEICDAIAQQSQRLSFFHTFNGMSSDVVAECSEALLARAPVPMVCLGKTGPILERARCGERIGESYGTSTFYAGTDHREAA